jgi:hypothetical protein
MPRLHGVTPVIFGVRGIRGYLWSLDLAAGARGIEAHLFDSSLSAVHGCSTVTCSYEIDGCGNHLHANSG